MGWDGMAWHGMAWDGMAWHGMAWHGMGWDGIGWTGWFRMAGCCGCTCWYAAAAGYAMCAIWHMYDAARDASCVCM